MLSLVARRKTGITPEGRTRQGRALLEPHRLELHCQPILDLTTGRIDQYELLVRLRTEGGDLLPPHDFLPHAERRGTILSIDSWVARQAAALIASEAGAGRVVTLNVNLSARSVGPALARMIDRTLEDVPVAAAHLVFELTETCDFDDIVKARSFVLALRARGCRFALDDFGKGFSSFLYLKHLPVDFYKIDGEFIRDYSSNRADRLIVDAIVGLARGLGKKTVAECVPDEATLYQLHRSGVDYAQGFHIGEPQPVHQVFPSHCHEPEYTYAFPSDHLPRR